MRQECELDCEATLRHLACFVKEYLDGAGGMNAVLGLSGGLDSALTAYICHHAVGPERLRLFFLPYRTSHPESAGAAALVSEGLGVPLETIEISPMVDAYFNERPDADRVRRGNKMARERMSVLFDQSAVHGGLVIGTSNRSEMLLGYGTLHGDLAAALDPLAGLYKTDVRVLAGHCGVPAPILSRPPSADLWEGQTDEGEFGYTYDEVDGVLRDRFDAGLSWRETAARHGEELVGRVRSLHEDSQFKRRGTIMPEPGRIMR